MNLKVVQRGRPRKDADKFKALKLYYEHIRNTGRTATVAMMCSELKRLSPTLDVERPALRKRVCRWLDSQKSALHLNVTSIHDNVIASKKDEIFFQELSETESPRTNGSN